MYSRKSRILSARRKPSSTPSSHHPFSPRSLTIKMSRILPALDYINTLRDEEILQYREQTLRLLTRLERVIGLPPRTSLTPEEQHLPTVTSDRDDDTYIGKITEYSEILLNILKRRLSAIKKYAAPPVPEAVGEAPAKREDPRIVDVQVCEGAKTKTPIKKFRKALATRSLSIEFMEFQRARLNSSRVDKQIKEVSTAADQSQAAAMEEFVVLGNFCDRAMAKSMIRYGTKMLVLEGLYGHCGISALLWIAPSWTRIGYSEITIFLELLLQSPKYDDIRAAADELSCWYEECQVFYDQKCKSERVLPPASHSHQELRKREAGKFRQGGITKVTQSWKHRRLPRASKHLQDSGIQATRTGLLSLDSIPSDTAQAADLESPRSFPFYSSHTCTSEVSTDLWACIIDNEPFSDQQIQDNRFENATCAMNRNITLGDRDSTISYDTPRSPCEEDFDTTYSKQPGHGVHRGPRNHICPATNMANFFHSTDLVDFTPSPIHPTDIAHFAGTLIHSASTVELTKIGSTHGNNTTKRSEKRVSHR
ncbi:hypothetical protein BDV28DRAFT_25386 [Aspergillus coremiiformis]|uniref:Uncharacterized protein n=1 Tax=Aspergillus coremiiformis TaxID=138285 RepID=A0A5N6Z519_9EURO|nr:hypothetical protein BDV28DRAFT_25386 [Aspergillus coremiiformis]